MSDTDALRETMTRLETPAYYDGAFQGMEEEVRELRSLLASCGDFRLEQWRNLVRDYDYAWKALKAQAQEIERLEECIKEALRSICNCDPPWNASDAETVLRAALGGGK